MKKIITLTFLLLSFINFSLAQVDTTQNNVWDSGIANTLKKDNRMYTVIAVLCIILIGIFFYLWRMDKKISKLENKK
jgi:CcmD family protein